MLPEFLESDAPYRCLWLAVILRAKQDAVSQNMMVENGSFDEENYPLDAQKFLTEESWDLEKVCEWAGVEVGSVLKVGRDLYGDTKTRAEWGADREVLIRASVRVRSEAEEI